MLRPWDTEEALSALEGLPLWGANRAVDMAIFKFGARHSSEHRGRPGEHGDYALHVQSPWLLLVEGRKRVGSEDSIERWVGALRDAFDPPVVVRRVILAADETLAIELSGRMSLAVTPFRDGDEYDEDWRLFSPGKDQPHLVHRQTGLSWE